MSKSKPIANVEDALALASKSLMGRTDYMERPRLYRALALAGCAKSDEEAMAGILYVAMARGRLTLDQAWDLNLARGIKDALRQLSNPGLDITTDVFSYQVRQIQLSAQSPSPVNQEGSELAKATLCHAVALEERQLMADIATLMGDTVYYGSREETVAEMDAGSVVIVEGLTKKLAEVVWRKGKLIREFGVQWFVEVMHP